MLFRYAREELAENRCPQPGKRLDDSPLFANLHNTQPERQDTGQSERYLESGLGRRKRGIDNLCEDSRISGKDKFAQRDDESD